MLGAILQAEGLEVQTAASGKAAIECLDHEDFDLVVTDLSMETAMAGYGVALPAKDHPHKPARLVISAYPELLNEWQSQGADAMLHKRCRVPELLALIRMLLERRGRGDHSGTLPVMHQRKNDNAELERPSTRWL